MPSVRVLSRQRSGGGVGPSVGVVVTCHQPYLRWLPQALASVERQTDRPDARVLVLDDCQAPAGVAGGWRIVRGAWHHPCPGRN
ncbi:MAG: hypothetical protein J7M26_10155, partial [Armatimonadetes bacterium]|nr:hypothetical protein [Armatimonadota bacterium]